MIPEDVFGKDYNSFVEKDPFNNNLVECYICRRSTELYGALLITKINGNQVTPQLILGTPKIHYPFDTMGDGARRYKFPSAKEIEVYIKYDGSNILWFSYSNGDIIYYSCKTRLRPFVVDNSRFGNFYSMWREVADSYKDEIRRTINKYGCNLSFELWGSRNSHTMMYKVPLTFSLLFGVTNTGRIIPPSKIECNLPKAKLFTIVDKDYVWSYEQIRKALQAELKQEGDYYYGDEGVVWYLTMHDGRTIQYKAKPDQIEAIHFAAGARTSRNSILNTVWNSLENQPVPTVEFVKILLAEEFKQEEVEANHYLISNCVDFVKAELDFRERVLNEYKKLGMNIIIQKVEVMRALSPLFNRKEMTKVFNTIKSFA